MSETKRVAGMSERGDNIYCVFQALAWIAKEQRDLQLQVDRLREIPNLVRKLIGERGKRKGEVSDVRSKRD
jgi:hypothetical protein